MPRMNDGPFCVIRDGALGDFLLTVPLLKAFAAKGELRLVCRRSHRRLIDDDIDVSRWLDSDSVDAASLHSNSLSSITRLFIDSCIIHTFQRTALPNAVFHDPRPSSPPSAARRFMEEAGLDVPDDFESTPPLRRKHAQGDALWVHTGSGSPSKNVPPEFWLNRLNTLPRNKIILSFGECETASAPLWKSAFRAAGIDFECVENPPLTELRRLLEERAAEFWGCDTGVTHLAASLGIPVKAAFVCTDWRIWRPLGNVEIIDASGEAPDGR